jgi:membrane-associated phospholipid phosphatase
MRGSGFLDAVQTAVPEWTTPAVEALTHLGDPLLVLVLLPAAYWVGPRYDLFSRRDGARLVAAGFCALALALVLKHGFGLPRPPTALHRIAEDGAGFPSGHAIAATVAYGGLAAVVGRESARWRNAVAGALILVVALTRVVLGVHYLVDVVAGVAAGAVALAVVLRVGRRNPTYGFVLAAVVGLAAVVLAGTTVEATMAVAGSAGAAVAWQGLGGRNLSPTGSLPVLAVGGGVLVAAVVWTLATAPPLPVVVTATVAAGAGVVALPAVAD